MTLVGILRALTPALSPISDPSNEPLKRVSVPPTVYPLAVAALARQVKLNSDQSPESGSQQRKSSGPLCVITTTSREAEQLAVAIRSFLPEKDVVVYPAHETLPHERLSPGVDTMGKRCAIMRRLTHPQSRPISVVVIPVRAAIAPQVRGMGDREPLLLRVGDEADLLAVATALTESGYERTDLVGRRGEFAVRGGILDVFPPAEEHPIRVEFFGDEVTDLRYFAVADQRSAGPVEQLWAPAARELLLDENVRKRASALATEDPALAELCTKLADGIYAPGAESLAGALLGPDGLELFVEALSADAIVVALDPERLRSRAADVARTSNEFLDASWSAAALGGVSPIDVGAVAFRAWDDVEAIATTRDVPIVELTPLSADIAVDMEQIGGYRGDVAAVIGDIKEWQARGDAVVITFGAQGPAQRAVEQLAEAGLGVSFVDSLVEPPPTARVTVAIGSLPGGFRAPGLVVLTESDLTGAKPTESSRRKMPTRRRDAVDPLQLTEGDFVVHEQHGVGRYIEMIRRTIGGAEREYLVVEYAPSKKGHPGDRLFIPTDQLHQLTRYVGGEHPALHRLGGSDWQRSKGRARKAVKEIAAELVRLYAARMSTPGHAFPPDTPWQRELEDAFAYAETPDQLAVIDEVKTDMEREVPMDRVVCGDVGYGKTEIAIRAAFKAVQDGKQVAVLVPTTLLARQHFATFTERMTQFPVKIAQLSRFVSPSQARVVLEGMAEGAVDVVIGTHRLLQNDIRFKDLGLVIVDEEQRFGVEHKEHLKHLRAAVDVLTLSATPIPRTLEMSLTGIREMSTIATPPEERHPVLTYVGAYDEKQIAAAIKRELLRDGQVFYLHNRVESIERAAARIRELVPEARVETGHGQMGETALERVMVGFWEKEYDVLVCTTIVESGLDIPNANTLIVERGDLFGLSQLHQIRGRVGRSRERGYAYFLYPPEQPLTETAHERLATIAQHSELGAGMYVAMKDLEIRGAGNLLGGEQSGHIAAIGFDLYVRMVAEAVEVFKGEGKAKEATPVETKIDLPINAHVPHTYVDSERLRLELYRKLAATQTSEMLDAVRREIVDRYGEPPAEVSNLFDVARLRIAAREQGVTDIAVVGRNIRFSPMPLQESKVMRLQRLYRGAQYRQATHTLLVPAPRTSAVGGQLIDGTFLVAWCHDLLKAVGE